MRKPKWVARWIASSVLMGMAVAVAQADTLTLPSGTELHVVLEQTLSTKTAATGETFRARLVIPVFLNEREALPLGTMVEGIVVGLHAPGRASGRAEMQLRPERMIFPDGRDYSLAASIESAKTGEDTKVDSKEGTIKAGGKDGINAKKTAVGAGIGAGVGAAVGGGMGAAAGAGAVGAVALLHQIFKRGKDAVLPAGSELVLGLTRPLSFSDMKEVAAPEQTQEKVDEKR